MKYILWACLIFGLTFAATRISVLGCSGEVEGFVNPYEYQSAQLPIDYRNTEKCKCCGGTGRIKVVPESR
jgi:hypothetical protein